MHSDNVQKIPKFSYFKRTTSALEGSAGNLQIFLKGVLPHFFFFFLREESIDFIILFYIYKNNF